MENLRETDNEGDDRKDSGEAMKNMDAEEDRKIQEEFEQREFANGVPIIIANASPFRLFQLNLEDGWHPSLGDINGKTYDYVKLHRTSFAIDVGLPKPFSMILGFDGSFILPAIPQFKERDNALRVFNKTIGELLFGGLYYEAISPNDLSFGVLHFNGYFKYLSTGKGANAGFHYEIGTAYVGILDAINLLNPPLLDSPTLNAYLTAGQKVLKNIPNVSIPVLINGITFLINKQWSEALTNLWTSIEQVINQIWEQEVIKNDATIDKVKGRKEFLKDFRTWTASAEIEVLYQKGLLDINTYQLLSSTRKARNEFIHKSTLPLMEDANNALKGLFALTSLVVTKFNDSNSLRSVQENILSYLNSDEKRKRILEKDEVVAWLPIPLIPGDHDWGDKPYEAIPEIQLKPIAELKH